MAPNPRASPCSLLARKYTITHLEGPAVAPPRWQGLLPPLEVVTKKALQHDMADADLLKAGSLGCPLPKEVRPAGMHAPPCSRALHPALPGGARLRWRGGRPGHRPVCCWLTNAAAAAVLLQLGAGLWLCNALPEALHPLSFRSCFGHNTNLWAFREEPFFAQTAGQAALFPPDFDFSREFFTPHDLGAGRRPCSGLPAKVAVAHRCPCPKDRKDPDAEECAAEEALVRKLAKQGLMVPPKVAAAGSALPWFGRVVVGGRRMA